MEATRPEQIDRFETDKTEWDRIANSQEFKDLMATKRDFIIPAFVFFIVYYFLLPVLVGYALSFALMTVAAIFAVLWPLSRGGSQAGGGTEAAVYAASLLRPTMNSGKV